MFFPDNAKRKSRIVEIGTDAQDYLNEATTDYVQFQNLLGIVNKQIAQVYKDSKLDPPSVKSVNLLEDIQESDHSFMETTVEISEVILDVAGVGIEMKYLAPAALKVLLKAGFPEDLAEKILLKFTLPLIEKNITITVGDIAGQVVGGIIGGVAIAGIDLGIDAVEGAVEKGELIDAIHQIYPQRTVLSMCQKKTSSVLKSITAVKTTLDAIAGAGLQLNEQVIQNLISKDVTPSITEANGYTLDSVEKDLHTFDIGRGSYIVDDPS